MNRFNTKHIKAAFGLSSSQYDEHAQLQQEILEECLELAKNYWQKGAHILDVGAGTGMFASSAHKQKLSWDITSLDMAFNMCKIARTQDSNSVNADAQSLPFADTSFDGIFSSLMLQWANDPLQVFKECIRVLRPGGRCVLSTFTHGTLEELRESFATLDDAVHVNEFGPPNYYSALAVHAGFRVLDSDETIITEYYPDVMALMYDLKAIGASTKQAGKPQKGLMTPRQLKQLEQAYRSRFMHEDGLPATWQVMIVLLEKPE